MPQFIGLIVYEPCELVVDDFTIVKSFFALTSAPEIDWLFWFLTVPVIEPSQSLSLQSVLTSQSLSNESEQAFSVAVFVESYTFGELSHWESPHCKSLASLSVFVPLFCHWQLDEQV